MCAQPGVRRSPSAHLNAPRVHMYALTEKTSTRMDISIWLGTTPRYPNRTLDKNKPYQKLAHVRQHLICDVQVLKKSLGEGQACNSSRRIFEGDQLYV